MLWFNLNHNKTNIVYKLDDIVAMNLRLPLQQAPFEVG